MVVLLWLLGGLAGLVLCGLPYWLFLRHEVNLTPEEWRARFPQRAWVPTAMRGTLVLGFLLFAPVFFTTDTRKEFNWFLLPLVFFPWVFALVGVWEVGVRTSVLFGSGSRGPVVLIPSPQALRAGILRLALTGPLITAFLWYR